MDPRFEEPATETVRALRPGNADAVLDSMPPWANGRYAARLIVAEPLPRQRESAPQQKKQTAGFDPVAVHSDVCDPGLESVHGTVLNNNTRLVLTNLKPSGTVQQIQQSAVAFPVQRVAVLLSSMGPEFELHDCWLAIGR